MTRPIPSPVHWDRAFWDAASRGVLVAQRCIECGHRQHYPRPACGNCLSRNRDWDELSGRGTIYSYTVVRQPVHPAFVDAAPYVFVDVALDEGLRMVSTMVGAGPNDVCIGDRVLVIFRRAGEVSLPYFVRDDDG